MKHSLNISWLWVSVAIICNILIFFFLSKHLENYVADKITDQETVKIY